MPFLRRSVLAPQLKSKYDGDYRAQLRHALSTPGLSAAQQKQIRAELARVGKPKVYQADAPPKPGAISFEKARRSKARKL